MTHDTSERVRKYDAFRRARTATWLAHGARHLALAAAGPRQAHTYHQYAIRLPQPAATTRTAPDYAPHSRTRPLGGAAPVIRLGGAQIGGLVGRVQVIRLDDPLHEL